LGYHFDWTRRTYREELQSPFPQPLAALAACFARAVGAPEFRAQAAIVNFYRPANNMGAHIDCSEDDHEHPVVSISLGLPAVFLVGTSDREEAPVPVLLRPGDVMLLSGEARLCYHGIAGICPQPVPLPHGYVQPREAIVALPGRAQDTLAKKQNKIGETRSVPHLQAVDAAENFADKGGCRDSVETDMAYYLAQHRININIRQVLLKGETRLLPR
jgi:hypothetical protein